MTTNAEHPPVFLRLLEGGRRVLRELADEELFARFRRGERPAFETLLRRHRAPLFTFVLRTLGPSERARAEDIVQDTFVRVIKASADWQHQAGFSTWLFTIARNLCLDQRRRDKHRSADSLDAPVAAGATHSLGETLEGFAPGPERQAMSGALRPAIELALSRLSDEQREVFILREYSGLPFKEIAQVQGIGENTVKSRMRYALESLRATLVELGIDGDLADDDVARPRAKGVGG